VRVSALTLDDINWRELIVRPSGAASLGPTAGAPFEIVLASGVVVRVPGGGLKPDGVKGRPYRDQSE
jgi:hypothetical protein